MNPLDKLLQEYVDSSHGIGASVCITHKDRVVFRKAAGFADLESRRPLECEDVFRIYSMTKMITAVAALRLFEQGRFQLDDPVSMYIPAFKDTQVLTYQSSDKPTPRPSQKEVTIRHLFTMTAGFAYPVIATKADMPRRYMDAGAFSGRAFKQLRQEERDSGKPLTTLQVAEAIASIPMAFEPGEGWTYGLCADILGAVVCAISGKSLGEYMREAIFAPLGMENTTFRPDASQRGRAATIYSCGGQGPTPIDTQDDPPSIVKSDATDTLEICVGGLYSTLDDYSRFMQMLANGGKLNGARVLGRKTVQLMATDHLTPVQYEDFRKMWYPQGYASWGLMTRVSTTLNNARLMLFPGSFGWAGAAGTVACADPAENLGITFMTQQIPSVSYGMVSRMLQVAYAMLD